MSFLTSLFGAKEPKFEPPSQSNKFSDTETTKDVGTPLSVVYGRAHVFGNVVFRQLANNDQDIAEAITLCWGPVFIDTHSILVNEKLPQYINGEINPVLAARANPIPWVSGDSRNYEAYTYVSYNSLIYRRNLGPASTMALVHAVNTPPDKLPMYWSLVNTAIEYLVDVRVATHDGHLGQEPAHGFEYGFNRTAYLYVTAKANDKVTSISNVECDVERPDLFVQGDDYATEIPATLYSAFPFGIPSRNPIAAGLDWSLNTDYGAGREVAIFGECSTFISSIQHCNALLALPDGSREYRYSIGIEVGNEKDTEHSDIIEAILAVANAQLFDSNGFSKVWMARAAQAVAELDRSNFKPSGASSVDMMDISNIIEVEYRQSIDGESRKVTWEDPSRIEDWREIRDSFEMKGIPTRTQAARMASFRGRRAFKERKSVEGAADQRFMTLEPGDIVAATLGNEDATWFSQKLFWVDEVVPDNKEGDVDLVLTEYGGDDLFDDGMASILEQNDPIRAADESVALPDPSSAPQGPPGVTGEVVIVNRKPTKLFVIQLDWSEPQQPSYMHQDFVIHRRERLTDEWQATMNVSGSQMSVKDLDADPSRKTYYYWIASRTSLGTLSPEPASGFDIFIDSLAATIPPTVTDGNVVTRADSRREITWLYSDEIKPVDFDGFIVKLCAGTTFNESTAFLLHDGVLTATKCTTLDLAPAGHYVIAIYVRDNFGNLSPPLLINYETVKPAIPDRFTVANLSSGFKFDMSYDSRAINLAGVKLRFDPIGQIEWTAAYNLTDGVVNSQQYTIPTLPGGTISVLAKAVDTHGNESDDVAYIIFNVNGVVASNVFQEFDFGVGGWVGDLTGGTIVGGSIVSDSAGGSLYLDDSQRLYVNDDALEFFSDNFVEMTYEQDFVAPMSGQILFDRTITGNGYRVDVKQSDPIDLYSIDADPFYTGDSFSLFDEPVITYSPWLGSLNVIGSETYGFRVACYGGPSQAEISMLKAKIDVPDMENDIENVAIPIGGIRLTLTKDFVAIKSVQLTLQHEVGSTAVTAQTADKDPDLGPLVICYDGSMASVAGLVDARVRGY